MESINDLKQMIADSKRIVFLGGAGVSTESGIPDFRSENGIFNAIREYGYPPETLLSRSFFDRHTETFFKYYRSLLMSGDAKPNKAHIALAKLEEMGKLTAIATQNIDGLHTMAGSKNVYELHGSIKRNYCMRCHKFYDDEFVASTWGSIDVPMKRDLIFSIPMLHLRIEYQAPFQREYLFAHDPSFPAPLSQH